MFTPSSWAKIWGNQYICCNEIRIHILSGNDMCVWVGRWSDLVNVVCCNMHLNLVNAIYFSKLWIKKICLKLATKSGYVNFVLVRLDSVLHKFIQARANRKNTNKRSDYNCHQFHLDIVAISRYYSWCLRHLTIFIIMLVASLSCKNIQLKIHWLWWLVQRKLKCEKSLCLHLQLAMYFMPTLTSICDFCHTLHISVSLYLFKAGQPESPTRRIHCIWWLSVIDARLFYWCHFRNVWPHCILFHATYTRNV